MIPFQVDFFPHDDDEVSECVATEFPALPSFGSRFIFRDSDRDITLMGTVFDVIYSDEDGEVTIVVLVRKTP